MAKEICISTTPHETRLAILEDDQLAEVYYERENEYTLAGSVYKGRVTRVLPGMQSSFVDVGLERDAFLYVTDFLEDSEDADEYETSNVGGRRAQAPAAAPAEEEPAAPASEESRGRRDGRRGRGRDRAAQSAEQPVRAQAAEERALATAALRAAEPTEEQSAEKGDDGSPEGTRKWRGRRGRRRGGVRAGGLGTATAGATVEEVETELSQPATAPFDLPERGAPGGLAAPFIVEQVEDEETGRVSLRASAARVEQPRAQRQESTDTPSKPVITLPGEAITKYGGTPAAAAKPERKPGSSNRPVNYTSPRPATLVDLNAAGWDGGAVLPGESLSRHRGTGTGSEPQGQPAAPREAEIAAAASAPGAELAAPETVAEALPETDRAETLVTHTEPLAEVEQTERAIEESTPPMEGEYEPEEGASASRNVPPQTSELRLSQLFGMGEKPAQAEEGAQRSTIEAGVEAGAEAGTEAGFQAGMEPEARHGSEASAPVPHEAHSIETVEVSEETERLEAKLEGVGTPAPADTFTGLVDQLHGFAPGSGVVEEETIDEEEYDFDPLHTHGEDADLEDLEEETLEGETAEQAAEPEMERVPRAALNAFKEEEREAFALEEIEEGEQEDAPVAAAGDAEPRRRERGEEGGRGGRTGGRRRGVGGGRGRQSAQTQDLPIISDLLKQGQEILVQIAKEPMAKKGARITSHIALPGRFLVFMPTVSHVGVSRKIASDEERQRLKRVLIHEKGESSGGFIVRTAAEGASEEELRADLRFLINLWTEIKQRADTAKAPALIYHDLNLVERILRDQVSSNFSTIWVDTEQEYERIVRFLNRFQPALVRRVKLYTKETPLFEHFGIQEEISKALKSKVWLKSGGSIVINQTEALVAIDINTGKYVGKTARLEDTIVKTNLDAIPEIVRQIRLRDLGGIIVIDFIDMDERRNRNRVLQALEEAMKVDRAPSKVLQFNDFGLVAITRKRVKQSLERTLSVQCEICAGTGMVKSPITVCNEIFIELRKMQKHLDGKEVLLRVHPEVVKQLKSGSGKWITEYEEIVGKTVILKSDPSLHPEQFDIQ